LSESATISNTITASAGYFTAISEGATASNAQTVQVQFLGNISELVSAADSLIVLKTLNVRPNGIQLIVSINDVLVWAVIDDSQNANWQNINNAQGVNWVLISNPSTPGWNDLPS
jgi:hypothetical protein